MSLPTAFARERYTSEHLLQLIAHRVDMLQQWSDLLCVGANFIQVRLKFLQGLLCIACRLEETLGGTDLIGVLRTHPCKSDVATLTDHAQSLEP